MKNFLVLFAVLFSCSGMASVFRVLPYQTLTSNKEVTLNFWPNKDFDVEVKIAKKKNGFTNFSISKLKAKNSNLQKISLGTLACNEALSYEIFLNNVKYEEVNLPALKCVEEKKPITIGFLSDTQIKNEGSLERALKLSELVERLYKENPFEVLINAGDIVQVGANLPEWIQFFDVAKPYLPKVYNVAAPGNHDYYETKTTDKMPDFFSDFFRSKNDPSLGNMSVELGKIKLIVLNSNFNLISESLIQGQWGWLRAELESAKKAGLFSVVVMHHAPYSSSAEHLRPIPRKLRAELVPILESYKNVHVVLSGHLHMYERSLKQNINYITAGPSGGIFNVISYKNEYTQALKQFVTTFTLVKINFPQITLETYDTDKNLVERYSFNVQK